MSDEKNTTAPRNSKTRAEWESSGKRILMDNGGRVNGAASEENHVSASDPQQDAAATHSLQSSVTAAGIAFQIAGRMELLHARMRLMPPFDTNTMAFVTAWREIETRLQAEPHLLRGSISWLAVVFRRILMAPRKTGTGLRLDPYTDDVVFRCDQLSKEQVKSLVGDVRSYGNLGEGAIANMIVQPYFTTQAMQNIIMDVERCQFSVAVVRQQDEFSCTIHNGVPVIHHVIRASRPDTLAELNQIRNAYAYVRYDDDRMVSKVAIIGSDRADAAKSRSQDSASWDLDGAEDMWKKTALRDLMNSMPLSPALHSLFSLQRGGKHRRMIVETF